MTKNNNYKKTILMTMLIVPLFTAGIAVGGIQNAYAGTIQIAIIINTPPIAVAQDVTKSANDQCLADVTPQEVDGGSSDPDGDPISLSLSPTGPFSLGNTPVALTVTDDSGAAVTATATVTVEDTTPPEITVPDGFMAIANTDGGWSGDIGQATATDVCSDVDIDNDAPAVFPLGDTIVTWCATDGAEIETCATQIINVKPLPVDIDIKPNSDPNSINPRSMGVVPVAILGSATFDVLDVDVTTLAFGPGGAAPVHDLTDPDVYASHLEDVNDDGFTDLVSHYVQKEAMPVEPEACLTGATLGGTPIAGCDSVRTPGNK